MLTLIGLFPSLPFFLPGPRKLNSPKRPKRLKRHTKPGKLLKTRGNPRKMWMISKIRLNRLLRSKRVYRIYVIDRLTD
jgi:hypothetical protein